MRLHNKMMRLHIFAIVLLVGYCANAQQKTQAPVKLKVPPLPPSTEDYLVAQLADAKWMPAQKMDPKIPPGAEVALIGADPVSTGPTIYMRVPAGYHFPAHWHTHHEYATMISGKGSYVVDGKKVTSSAGTFIVIPSKTKHEFRCDAGAECVFVVRRSGPTDINWVAK